MTSLNTIFSALLIAASGLATKSLDLKLRVKLELVDISGSKNYKVKLSQSFVDKFHGRSGFADEAALRAATPKPFTVGVLWAENQETLRNFLELEGNLLGYERLLEDFLDKVVRFADRIFSNYTPNISCEGVVCVVSGGAAVDEADPRSEGSYFAALRQPAAPIVYDLRTQDIQKGSGQAAFEVSHKPAPKGAAPKNEEENVEDDSRGEARLALKESAKAHSSDLRLKTLV